MIKKCCRLQVEMKFLPIESDWKLILHIKNHLCRIYALFIYLWPFLHLIFPAKSYIGYHVMCRKFQGVFNATSGKCCDMVAFFWKNYLVIKMINVSVQLSGKLSRKYCSWLNNLIDSKMFSPENFYLLRKYH